MNYTKEQLIRGMDMEARASDPPVVVIDKAAGKTYEIIGLRYETSEESTGPTLWLQVEEN